MFPGVGLPRTPGQKLGASRSLRPRALRYHRRDRTRQAVCHAEVTMKCVEFQDVKKETVSRTCHLEDPRTINSHWRDVASSDDASRTLRAGLDALSLQDRNLSLQAVAMVRRASVSHNCEMASHKCERIALPQVGVTETASRVSGTRRAVAATPEVEGILDGTAR